VAAIVHNAGEFLAIRKEHGSFAGFLDTLRPLPGEEALARVRGRFKGAGPETADYFLHAVGLTF
jgi:DNA-3-methyladenine glycosylase I